MKKVETTAKPAAVTPSGTVYKPYLDFSKFTKDLSYTPKKYDFSSILGKSAETSKPSSTTRSSGTIKCRHWWSKNCIDPDTGEMRTESKKTDFFSIYGKNKKETKPE